MKYEHIHGMQIPKVGFGTWTIGGRDAPDPGLDSVSRAALRSALELGYTHFDTAEYYAGGHAEELLGEAIREMGVRREDLFITTKVSPEHLHYEDVLTACDRSLRRLGVETIDLYLIHWANPRIKLAESFRALNQLVREGKVRHLGVSNFKLKLLKESVALSETPLLTNQVPYRLPEKDYAENGVVEYCQQNDILVTAYSPVKFRNLNVNATLKAMAAAHNATSFQVAMAWLIAQPRVITIPMSFNPAHQRENLEAMNLELTASEMEQLSNLYSR
ncbi:MAG: aldo/keto reductase [Chloroflexi bacterium]|nr:aldo/keto reductase [Chloroflexota bacterium]